VSQSHPLIILEETSDHFLTLGVANTGNKTQIGFHDDKKLEIGPLAEPSTGNMSTPAMTIDNNGEVTMSGALKVYENTSDGYVGYFSNDNTSKSQKILRLGYGAGGDGTHDGSFIDFWGNNDYQIIGSITPSANGWATMFNDTSDRRLKKNIVPTSFGLDDLMKLEVCDYNWKSDTSSSTLSTGLIAQDVGKVYPPAATIPSENSDKYAQIDYGKFTPLLIKVVQDQQKVIDDLQKRITKMENI